MTNDAAAARLDSGGMARHGQRHGRGHASGFGRRGCPLGKEKVAVDDRGGEVDELAVVDPGALPEHLERNVLVD